MTESTSNRPNTTAFQEFVLRTTSDGVFIADESGTIILVNPAGAAMLGTTVDEIIDKKPQAIFRKHHNLINLFNRTGSQTLDVRLPRRRIAQGIADTLPNGERIVMLQDVTEKRDLEDRREQLSRAIAHDLRNPISAITGFSDLVSRFGDLNDQQDKFLRKLRQTSGKLHDMITSLVNLAWIEAGMPLEHMPIRLDEVIQKTVIDLSEIAQKNNIGIATSIQRPLPVVMGDPERLNLVIHHLIQNAILYSEPEKNIVVHAWGDENEVYCSVADRGFGIADNEINLIFDRMYRSRDVRVTEIAGGGLGLTIARTIVQRHGGDLWATSNLGDGSTFTFVLPSVEL